MSALILYEDFMDNANIHQDCITYLDTETTGLLWKNGDRLCEIAAITVTPDGKVIEIFHRYINPQRRIPTRASDIHGLTNAFLDKKQTFSEIADDLIEFLKGKTIVIHNASFDLGFINNELALCGKGVSVNSAASNVICSLREARRHWARNNKLDDLCQRYSVDLSIRTKHSAICDCLLLAQVYRKMTNQETKPISKSEINRVLQYPIEKQTRTSTGCTELPDKINNDDSHESYQAQIKQDPDTSSHSENFSPGLANESTEKSTGVFKFIVFLAIFSAIPLGVSYHVGATGFIENLIDKTVWILLKSPRLAFSYFVQGSVALIPIMLFYIIRGFRKYEDPYNRWRLSASGGLIALALNILIMIGTYLSASNENNTYSSGTISRPASATTNHPSRTIEPRPTNQDVIVNNQNYTSSAPKTTIVKNNKEDELLNNFHAGLDNLVPYWRLQYQNQGFSNWLQGHDSDAKVTRGHKLKDCMRAYNVDCTAAIFQNYRKFLARVYYIKKGIVQADPSLSLLENLKKNLKGVEAQNTDQAFINWLQEYDQNYGGTRQNFLNAAAEANDIQKIYNLFVEYRVRTGRGKF